jgi:Galactose-1-phosphate uridylyltransferase
MDFARQELRRTMLDPRAGFAPVESVTEVRWDPLTGHTARVLRDRVPLLPPSDVDLTELAAATRAGCPFCPERVREVTPSFPPALVERGRIDVGAAVLFPNLLTYADHSSVCVYSPELHHLPLAAMTPALVADNLAAQVEFCRAVQHAASAPGQAAGWASVNANHMLPSGSSVFHPHTQGAVNSVPTNEQRLLAEVPAPRFRDFVDAERRNGRRYLGGSPDVEWLAAFAPLGPAELRAFVWPARGPADLGRPLVDELGEGIATAMTFYAELGYSSCNWALYGAPADRVEYPLNLRMVLRSNVAPLYRSDVTWLERLHHEAATDVLPEDLADRAGNRFRR